MLKISNEISIPLDDIEITAIRAQGAGGQHVNKASTAVQLRFDIRASSLLDFYKQRLLALPDRRISDAGVVIIKAQQYRSQAQNRNEVLRRLQRLIQQVVHPAKKRIPTQPSRRSKERRLDRKKRRGQIKTMRRKVDY